MAFSAYTKLMNSPEVTSQIDRWNAIAPKSSWYGDYLQAFNSNDPGALEQFANQGASTYADWDPIAYNFAINQRDSLNRQRGDKRLLGGLVEVDRDTWADVGQLGGNLGALGLLAGGAYAGLSGLGAVGGGAAAATGVAPEVGALYAGLEAGGVNAAIAADIAAGVGAGAGLGASGAGGASGASGASGTVSSAAPSSLAQIANAAASAIPAIAGAYGAKKQADAYRDVANQYTAMGEPYRSRLADLYNDPSSFLQSEEVMAPVQQATNILARSLSTQGNPVGSGNALQELQNYASKLLFGRLGEEKDRLAGFGGLTQYASAAPQAQMAGIGAQKGVYDAIGAGAADVFNPPKRFTLLDLIKDL